LRLLGEGRQAKYLARLCRELGVADRVRFEGWVSRDTVLEALMSADAMIAPSMYEGSGFAVAEAVSLGCPVVGTRRGGIEVMVTDGLGILVEADAALAVSLADALQRLGPRHAGTFRWSATALERDLRSWYELAIAT
jgi:glycosyltransferase involved in cell wall biosynthesis